MSDKRTNVEEQVTVAQALVTVGLFVALSGSVAICACKGLWAAADHICKAERSIVNYGAVVPAPRFTPSGGR